MQDQVKYLLHQLELKIIKQSSTHFFISCPFSARHEGGLDTNPSMSIEFTSPYRVHCFGCGWSAKHISTLVKAIGFIRGKDYSNLIIEFELPSFEQIDDVKVKKQFDSLKYEYKNKIWQKVYHPYLQTRGITETAARVWGLGFDAYRQNVTFPILDRDGILRGITGRAVTQKGHFNYFFSKDEYIFGEQFLHGTVICVEGQTDCVRLWQTLAQLSLLDTYSVCSLLGAAPSDTQVNKLVTSCDRIIIFFDNDKAGRKGSSILKKKVGGRLPVLEIDYSLLSINKYGDQSIRENKIDPDRILSVEPEKIVKLLNETKIA